MGEGYTALRKQVSYPSQFVHRGVKSTPHFERLDDFGQQHLPNIGQILVIKYRPNRIVIDVS